MSRWRDYLTGFCQAFALFSDPRDFKGYPHRNEAEALEGDWRKVGDAMWGVIGELEKTIAEEKARHDVARQEKQAPMDDRPDAGRAGRDRTD